MRGEALILATLVVAAAPARAADVLAPPSASPTSAAPATPAAWPGFEISNCVSFRFETKPKVSTWGHVDWQLAGTQKTKVLIDASP